jgi:SpoIID/LytB domain protein
MAATILGRDVPRARVFQGQTMLMQATYQGPSARPPRRRGASAATLALLLTLALAPALMARSALAAPATNAPMLVITGAGEGHGVGMSQDGAFGYAQHGASFQEILAHYYTGTSLGQAPPKSIVRVLVGSHVKRIPLEKYVRGVVGAEMPSTWPLAALEAQAVASRTYALTDHAGGSRFDVYADTRSQVYRGAAAETASTKAAVAATAGQIVTYEGRPAITYFFASSGGMTEDVENGFPGSEPEPWLRGVVDPYDKGKTFQWKTTLTMAAAGRSLRGLFKGSFRGVEVLRRGVSPRIVSARVLGSRDSTVVNGPELAGRLGLSSTWAYFSVRTAHGTETEPDHSGNTQAPATAPTPSPGVSPQGGVPPTNASGAPQANGGSLGPP